MLNKAGSSHRTTPPGVVRQFAECGAAVRCLVLEISAPPRCASTLRNSAAGEKQILPETERFYLSELKPGLLNRKLPSRGPVRCEFLSRNLQNARRRLAGVNNVVAVNYTMTEFCRPRLPGFALTTAASLLALVTNAAELFVSNANDSGTGSLRQALADANANPGPDRIAFNVSGPGVHTVKVLSALPPLTDPVVVDAFTQPGHADSPLFELNGASTPSGTSGLRILVPNCTIRGLAINRFPGEGIRIEGGGTNLLEGNFIGIDPTGTLARGNGREGILISGSWSNIVGGGTPSARNVISGNGDAGLYIYGGGGNGIQGNYVGTDLTGTVAVGNTNNGIAVYGSRANLFQGGNLLSGNRGSGIYIIGGLSVSNIVSGNLIGTTVSVAAGLSNAADGITIESASWNFIGGSDSGLGNALSGNGKTGLSISGPKATNNVVMGNLIGTDSTGAIAIPNGSAGIWIRSANGNQVGGSLPGCRHVISGNQQDGIYILSNSTANVILGNFIGVKAGGSAPLPNGYNGISLATRRPGMSSGEPRLAAGTSFRVTWVTGFNSRPARPVIRCRAILSVPIFRDPRGG